MVKLQEELMISVVKKNKSGSINRFESLFLQFKKIKKTCQGKNAGLQKKFFRGNFSVSLQGGCRGDSRIAPTAKTGP
jgi:hypothetical protein